jgi:serine/threonine-protein kinase
MPPTTADLFLPLQEALKGRYWLERELGRGGMGIVYLAQEVALDRPVALKLLPPALAREGWRRERFLHEARTAARLSHPNIVPVFAVEEVGEFVFFTMAYVEGVTLAHRVRDAGPLPTSEATRVLRDVAWAVAYAHAQGVIHRDLKAENILLEHGSGRPLVTDFGIAQVKSQPELGGERRIVGTFQYMSPEQVRGGTVDERSDVYSLGVVGYMAASGSLPFRGATATEIADQQINRPPPPLETAGQEFDHALARAVERCLAKQPDQRFQTAGDLAEALEERRELPLPLRAFLWRARYVSRSDVGLTLLRVLAGVGLIAALARGNWGAAAIAGAFTALVLVYPVAVILPVTRRVLRAGYGREDIVRALGTDLEREREELAFHFGADPSPVERLARGTAYAGFGLVGVAAGTGMVGILDPGLAAGAMVLGALTTLIAGTVAAYLYYGRRYVPGARWLKLWKSRLGEGVTRLAGVGLGRPAAGAPSAARRSETAIAMSAERMFHELPEALRQAVSDLPDCLRQMKLHTGGLRKLIAELDESLAGEGDDTPELVDTREDAQQRLTETVTALERMRLELHGLHDGTSSVEDLQADLAAAREVTEAVDRVLAERGTASG